MSLLKFVNAMNKVTLVAQELKASKPSFFFLNKFSSFHRVKKFSKTKVITQFIPRSVNFLHE